MTVYANLVDGEVKGVYDLLPKTWNNILNFDVKARLDRELMTKNNFVEIERDKTDFDPRTHKMSDFPTYFVKNGVVFESREILPK
jgi:hypothetical protein